MYLFQSDVRSIMIPGISPDFSPWNYEELNTYFSTNNALPAQKHVWHIDVSKHLKMDYLHKRQEDRSEKERKPCAVESSPEQSSQQGKIKGRRT